MSEYINYIVAVSAMRMQTASFETQIVGVWVHTTANDDQRKEIFTRVAMSMFPEDAGYSLLSATSNKLMDYIAASEYQDPTKPENVANIQTLHNDDPAILVETP